MRHLIIFLSFLFFYSNAQPLPSIIIVDSISFSKKPLFVKKIKANNVETIYFLSSSMKKTIPMAITNKSRNVFIYKKDTMDIYINLEERRIKSIAFLFFIPIFAEKNYSYEKNIIIFTHSYIPNLLFL